MKILMREYGRDVYVWKTTKYNNNRFYVDGQAVNESNIVSIVNDNRKNYIQCSSCGQVFRKGDRKFEEHKVNAVKPDVCLECDMLCVDGRRRTKRKYIVNMDGTYTEKTEMEVKLFCSKTGVWSYSDINSEKAIKGCNKRQCHKANEQEISDFFTKNPGVFDDILTVDKLLEDGHNVVLNSSYNVDCVIESGPEYTLYAIINKLGIVDGFEVWTDGNSYRIYYSKKYNEIFYGNVKYSEWYNYDVNPEMREEIKTIIANLYR